MGIITTTRRPLGDDALNPAITFGLAEASPTLDTVAKRLVVTSSYRFAASTGGQMSGTKTTMLSEHPALTAAQRTSLLQFLGAIYNYDLDHDPLA